MRFGRSLFAIGVLAVAPLGAAAEAECSKAGGEDSDHRDGASFLQLATNDQRSPTHSSIAAKPVSLPEVSELLQAMTAAGVSLHPGLEGASFMHGGQMVRGLHAKGSISTGAELIKVPQEMWITGMLPDSLKLDQVPACENVGDIDMLGQVVQLHQEQKKGASSKFHQYMRALPTLQDYRGYLPALADDALLHDFRGLSYIASSVKDHRQFVDTFTECVQALKSHVPDISDISHNTTVRWMLVAATRRYAVPPAGSALIPVSELMNTANRDKMNTEWTVAGAHFEVEARNDVAAGDELFDVYCTTCGNDAMLVTWGLILAGNPNPLTSKADCSQLHTPTLAALDVNGTLPSAATAKCSTKDGIRCSFARLALEHCGQQWSQGSKTNLVERGGVVTHRHRASAERAAEAMTRRLVRGGVIGSARLPPGLP